MAFARADALAYLSGVLADWLEDAKLNAADEPRHLAEPIDDAYLAVGVGWADLATATVVDADVPGFRAVLRWKGLTRVLDAVANRVDIEVTGDGSKDRHQAVTALTKQVEAAAAAAAPFVTVGADTPRLVNLRTPYLAPLADYAE